MVTLILLAGIAVLLFAMELAHNSKVGKPSQEDIASEAISTDVTENDTTGLRYHRSQKKPLFK